MDKNNEIRSNPKDDQSVVVVGPREGQEARSAHELLEPKLKKRIKVQRLRALARPDGAVKSLYYENNNNNTVRDKNAADDERVPFSPKSPPATNASGTFEEVESCR